jgi:DUF1009 family protein
VNIKKLALVAGSGELPLIFLRQAVKNGIDIFIIEVEGEENPGLKSFRFERVKVKLALLSDMIKEIADRKIRHVIFLGYIRPIILLKDILFDEITRKMLLSLKDKRPKALMESAIDRFKKAGITAVPTTYLMEEILAPEGFISIIRPDMEAMGYMRFSVEIASRVAALDVGQTIVTGSGMIWAVEAMEGTDNCIKRGGAMAKKGFMVIKMARPKQDLRYDVPTIGLKTLKLIKSLGGSGIVVEAGKTFLLNKEEMKRYADNNNIFIYGWRSKK